LQHGCQGNIYNSNNLLEAVSNSIENKISGDMPAIHNQQALHYPGDITAEDLPGKIFGKFCIGK
jgi:tRNA U34 5-carboxymethylaminomethyl modifying GTPase MnmE/TrmE